jgi:hypothetical protein
LQRSLAAEQDVYQAVAAALAVNTTYRSTAGITAMACCSSSNTCRSPQLLLPLSLLLAPQHSNSTISSSGTSSSTHGGLC